VYFLHSGIRVSLVNQNISVDCVIFGFDFKHLNVLLVDRILYSDNRTITFSDQTLLGNHVFQEEDIYDAASRILKELTGFTDIYLEQFHTFADPNRLKQARDRMWLEHLGRDPDNRVISVGYYSLLNCHEVELNPGSRQVEWVPVDRVGKLGFDHNLILNTALEHLKLKVMQNPIAYQLLPRKFTLSQLQKLYEVIFDMPFDKRNFRKKAARMKYLVALEERQTGVAHKPAQLFRFDRSIFEKTKKELFDFTI